MPPFDRYRITLELEIDLYERNGAWHARLPDVPEIEIGGIGMSRDEALLKAKAFALRAMADRTETETAPQNTSH